MISALEHAALLGMPLTLCAVATGCLQMRHAELDGCREHNGTMVIASGTARVMINFNLVEDCWITWSQGACGRTRAIELYDRHGGAVSWPPRPGRSPPSPRKPGISSSTISPPERRMHNTPIAGKPGLRGCCQRLIRPISRPSSPGSVRLDLHQELDVWSS